MASLAGTSPATVKVGAGTGAVTQTGADRSIAGTAPATIAITGPKGSIGVQNSTSLTAAAPATVTMILGDQVSTTVSLPGAAINGAPPGSCIDDTHFQVDLTGALLPQPWMQYRCVSTVTQSSVSMSFAPTTASSSPNLISDLTATLGALFGQAGAQITSLLGGIGTDLTNLLGGVGEPDPSDIAGGAKNVPLYTLTTQWRNNTPVNQWVYGLITLGGIRVTVQARTRMYVVVSSGFTTDPVFSAPLTVSSVVGCGADIGLGGVLDIGTAFCIMEERQNAVSFYVAPEIPGWTLLAPGQTFTAAVQCTLASPYWETSSIDGGNQDTNTSFEIGGTQLDIFATPAL